MRVAWSYFQNTNLGTILRVSHRHASPGGQASTHHTGVSHIIQARYTSHGSDYGDSLSLGTCSAPIINGDGIFVVVCLNTF